MGSQGSCPWSGSRLCKIKLGTFQPSQTHIPLLAMAWKGSTCDPFLAGPLVGWWAGCFLSLGLSYHICIMGNDHLLPANLRGPVASPMLLIKFKSYFKNKSFFR